MKLADRTHVVRYMLRWIYSGWWTNSCLARSNKLPRSDERFATSINRSSLLRIPQFLAVGVLFVLPVSALAQTLTATITAGSVSGGGSVAVNTVTNEIYVANVGSRSVTVVEGGTNSTTTVPAGLDPIAVAVNEATNKIYVAARGDCNLFGNCSSAGDVTVIDGATKTTITITDPNANGPIALAVNSATNKIYVANIFSSNVTVIDGTTNSIATVTDPNAAGIQPVAVAVNSVTNQIYVANNNLYGFVTNSGNITVIDGVTNSTTTVTDPNAIAPQAIGINLATNKIYVANEGDYPGSNHGNVTVIDGATNSTTTIAVDPNALAPLAVAVNQTTDTIYVATGGNILLTGNGGVTIIDGPTNSISTITDPNASFPNAVAVDETMNTIYVANQGCFLDDPCINPGSVTFIDGATNALMTLINPDARNPSAVALDQATRKVYVGNAGSNNVTVIDGSAGPTTHVLSLLLAASGTGSVISSPAGINCSASCTASFTAGTSVSLTASPAAGSIFSGWSTNCSGTGPCNVMMNSDEFVSATFSSDFSIQPALGSLTSQPGGQVTDVITITPQNGSVESTVQLSCKVTGSTPTATCGLSPTSVTPGANPAKSTLTVKVPGVSAQLSRESRHQFPATLLPVFLPLPGLALIALGLKFGKPKQRRRGLDLLSGLVLAFVAFQVGCAGGSSVQKTQALNYTVTITASLGSVQHTTQVQVTVQ